MERELNGLMHNNNLLLFLNTQQQAQKCSEETHLFGDLQCTRVSADLKCARSQVRISEITATLQEQK